MKNQEIFQDLIDREGLQKACKKGCSRIRAPLEGKQVETDIWELQFWSQELGRPVPG